MKFQADEEIVENIEEEGVSKLENEEKVDEILEEQKKKIVKEEIKKTPVEYVEDKILKGMNPLERDTYMYKKSEGYIQEVEKKDYLGNRVEDNYSGKSPSADNTYWNKPEFDFKSNDDERRRKQAII